MEIKLNTIYKNRTYRYLRFIFTFYPLMLQNYLNACHKLAYGLGDELNPHDDRVIFILFDSDVNSNTFEEFLSWLRNQSYYVSDYPYSKNLKNVRKHMIVFKVIEEFEATYDNFLTGKYSKMYNSRQLNLIFPEAPSSYVAYNVFAKTDKAFKLFQGKLNKKFGESFEKNEYEDLSLVEYDLPIEKREEFFDLFS